MDQLTLAGTALDSFHVCAFFDSRDEGYEILHPYYRQAMEQGEKNLHLVDPDLKTDHLERLVAHGIDGPGCQACGQLELVGWDQAYFDETGRFNKDQMLATVDKVTTQAREAGYKRLRIMGHMDWAFRDAPGSEDLIEYEAEVNEVLERNRQPAICVYDTALLTGAMMMDLLRTHPLTLVGGVVQENPFFTPPAEMLKELKARKARVEQS
ncbi:hypothetical protein GT347_05765 [Xylophilus rhododendri]|uniref:MEDS domain-containing protein n=1 Tax=Xylophilus rhododendri TaxID=2697032 RepID=A0A857J3T6_9BURK|nr:MEDS domain-containing protein [Xylophilus rhododendri]QHI97538.1 hypothetical protein GT347_05765 [Xylophilus rhododendri]